MVGELGYDPAPGVVCIVIGGGALDRESLYRLLYELKEGNVTPAEALEKLAILPYEDLGYARIDHHRALRRGFPEVIFGSGKTVDQITRIAQGLKEMGQSVLVTRVDPSAAASLKLTLPEGEYFESSRLFFWGRRAGRHGGRVVVATGGTADLPVAEEAAVALEVMGNEVERLYDVGVAGVHRLLSRVEDLRSARVIIAVAGMDGALASVVSGLVDVPVVAVPTSVGYGASFGGVAALLSMLNSCSSGVGVVNIDNGFGAAALANLINR